MNYPHPMDDKTGFEATDAEMNLGNAPVIIFPKVAKPVPVAPLHASGFDFKFDDLHIEIEGGFGAGSFEGTAEVSYYDDEGYLQIFVGDITLHCSKFNRLTGQYDVHHVRLEYAESSGLHRELYLAIWGELTEGSWKDAVEARVEEDRA